jgi:hypothetical protein
MVSKITIKITENYVVVFQMMLDLLTPTVISVFISLGFNFTQYEQKAISKRDEFAERKKNNKRGIFFPFRARKTRK